MTKTNKEVFNKLIKSLGVSEQDLIKETSNAVLTPKMAIIGTLESIKFVCDSLQHQMLTTPGVLNVDLVRLYLTAISSSSVYTIDLLKQYQIATETSPNPLSQETYELSENDLNEVEDLLNKEEAQESPTNKQNNDTLKDFVPVSKNKSDPKKQN